ncbi:MAG: 4-hydroxy-3-methylbut-2-enyl diphosphate reductase [Candidatus Anammoxibacter sp.]
MKIAKNAGFCMGVRRAMDIVLDTASKVSKEETVYTEGPLIHNPQVLEFLEKKGIGVLDETTDAKGTNVVIRAHGITPSRRDKIESLGAKICDATCPNVKSVQSIIKKYAAQGYTTLIIGDKGHAEVDGLLGYTEDNGYVVENLNDISNLPAMDKVCIVSQTTQSRDVFKEISKTLKEKYKDCKTFETICNSTSKRQKDVFDLSNDVDAMVVVGGRGSANTKRLAEISEAMMPTFLVETEEELDMEKLKRFSAIGVTAGASTPNWMINRVVDKIESCEQNYAFSLLKCFKFADKFIIGTCVYLSIGAGFMSYASSVLLGIDPKLLYCVIAALFVFALYMLNNVLNKENNAFSDPLKAQFYNRHYNALLGLGILGAVSSLGAAFFVSLPVFYCLFFLLLFGNVYGLRIVPKSLSNIVKYNSVAQIPGTKEIFVSIAWAICTVLIIFLGNSASSIAISTFAVTFTFTLAITFIRGVFLDIRAFQGDRIIGKETISVAIGKSNTKIILAIILFLTTALLIVSPTIGWTSSLSYYLLPCLAYACCYLYLYHKRIIKKSRMCEVIADFNFILAGIMAYVWRINQVL